MPALQGSRHEEACWGRLDACAACGLVRLILQPIHEHLHRLWADAREFVSQPVSLNAICLLMLQVFPTDLHVAPHMQVAADRQHCAAQGLNPATVAISAAAHPCSTLSSVTNFQHVPAWAPGKYLQHELSSIHLLLFRCR